MKIEKNELKQVKSFFKILKAEYKSLSSYKSNAKGWLPGMYIKIDSYPEYGYINFMLVKTLAKDEINFEQYRLKIHQTAEALSCIIPIDYIDFLEASEDIIIQDGLINSVKIETDLNDQDQINLCPGHSLTAVEKMIRIPINKEALKELKDFAAMNKAPKKNIGNEVFSYYCFHHETETDKKRICFTDGSRLNTKDLEFKIKENKGIEGAPEKTFLLHQDNFKSLIPIIDSILKTESMVHLYMEYGYIPYTYYQDDLKKYKTQIEITSGPEGYKHHLTMDHMGELKKYPDILKVIEPEGSDSFIEILLDEKAREETKKIELLKSHIDNKLTLEIEPNKLLIKGNLLFQDKKGRAGSFEMDLSHLACIECKEKAEILIWKDNLLSMLKEIGNNIATITTKGYLHPLNYKTNKTEGLCTTLRPM